MLRPLPSAPAKPRKTRFPATCFPPPWPRNSTAPLVHRVVRRVRRVRAVRLVSDARGEALHEGTVEEEEGHEGHHLASSALEGCGTRTRADG